MMVDWLVMGRIIIFYKYHPNYYLPIEFIGEIMDVKADELVLTENQLTDIEKIKPTTFGPGGSGY
jgi:hypothetical protein